MGAAKAVVYFKWCGCISVNISDSSVRTSCGTKAVLRGLTLMGPVWRNGIHMDPVSTVACNTQKGFYLLSTSDVIDFKTFLRF